MDAALNLRQPIAGMTFTRLDKPEEYRGKIGAMICTMLESGMTLKAICAYPSAPSEATIYRWLERFPSFREAFTHAREAQTHSMASEVITIADRPDLDPNDKKVRVDARKWYTSKMMPKTYGDKLDITADVTVHMVPDDMVLQRLKSMLTLDNASGLPVIDVPGTTREE